MQRVFLGQARVGPPHLVQNHKESKNTYLCDMKSRGFGDTVVKVTRLTGIKSIVDKVSEVLEVDCGCAKRQELLNNILPYKK